MLTDRSKRSNLQKRVKKRLISFIIILPLAVALVTCLTLFVIIPSVKYNHAKQLLEEGNYELAYTEFKKLDGYSDSEEMLLECRYLQAIKYRDAGDFEVANKIFENLSDYRDSKLLIHNHEYKIFSNVLASCTTAGSETYMCSSCGDTYVKFVPQTHSYVLFYFENASCTNSGINCYRCSHCGVEYSEKIPKKTHSFSLANCNNPKTCSNCGITEGEALGHTEGVECSRCGQITFETLYYSGTGSRVIDYTVPKGKFKITVTMTAGTGSVDVKVHYTGTYGDTYEWLYIINAGNSEVEYVDNLTSGTIVVNASSSYSGESSWVVTIEAVGN